MKRRLDKILDGSAEVTVLARWCFARMVLALEGRCCLDGLVEVLRECSPEHEADYEPGDLKKRARDGKG